MADNKTKPILPFLQKIKSWSLAACLTKDKAYSKALGALTIRELIAAAMHMIP